MSRISIRAAVLFTAMAGPACAGTLDGKVFPPTDPRETCDTLAESMVGIRVLADNHHVVPTILDGERAHRFLAAINPSGSKIVLQADRVAIFRDLTASTGAAFLFDGECGGWGSIFAMHLSDLDAALAAARR